MPDMSASQSQPFRSQFYNNQLEQLQSLPIVKCPVLLIARRSMLISGPELILRDFSQTSLVVREFSISSS